MAKEEGIELEGIVHDSNNGQFKIEVPMGNDKPSKIITGHLSGKMRKNFIRVLPGDSVKVEVSPYDMGKGRITFRQKNKPNATQEPKPDDKN